MALRREEGEQHAAADEQTVDPRQQVRDDAELVGHLGAAEHDRVRALRVLGEAVQHVELGLDQQSRRGRQDLGELVDAGLLAVHDAEAVGDERVAEGRELLREGAALGVVLRGLSRVEPQVLQHEHAAGLQGGDGLLRRRADRVRRERDRLAEQLASRVATGARLYCGSGAPSGRPRCEQTITRAP